VFTIRRFNMKYDDAVRVIENCAGFTEMDCSAGEAWAVVQERIAALEDVVEASKRAEAARIQRGKRSTIVGHMQDEQRYERALKDYQQAVADLENNYGT